MFCYEFYYILLLHFKFLTWSLVFNLEFVTLSSKKAILINQKPVNSFLSEYN